MADSLFDAAGAPADAAVQDRESSWARLRSESLASRRFAHPQIPPAPPLKSASPVYDKELVDTYVGGLIEWATQQAHRADSAEKTLAEVLVHLTHQAGKTSSPEDPQLPQINDPAPVEVTPVLQAGTPTGQPVPPPKPRNQRPPIPAERESTPSTPAGLRRIKHATLSALVVVAACAGVAFLLSQPAIMRPQHPTTNEIAQTASSTNTNTNTNEATTNEATTMVLTSSEVRIGNSYSILASGFTPGEPVRLAWTGPTHGVMDSRPADSTGIRRHGPVSEADPPGAYTITATGLTSGRTASHRLRVMPAAPQAPR